MNTQQTNQDRSSVISFHAAMDDIAKGIVPIALDRRPA